MKQSPGQEMLHLAGPYANMSFSAAASHGHGDGSRGSEAVEEDEEESEGAEAFGPSRAHHAQRPQIKRAHQRAPSRGERASVTPHDPPTLTLLPFRARFGTAMAINGLTQGAEFGRASLKWLNCISFDLYYVISLHHLFHSIQM